MALTVSGPVIPVTLSFSDKATKNFKVAIDKIDQASNKLKATLGGVSHGFRRTAILLASYTIFERVLVRMTANLREFEEGMATVSTFVDTTKVNMEKLKEEAILLRAQTVFTFSEITDAMSEAIQRGVKLDSVYAFLLQSAKAATAGNASLTDMVNITAGAWTVYGEELGSVSKIQDAFFATQDVGNIKIAQLAGQLGRILPVAALAGVGFNEVLAAVAALTRAELPVAQAITRMTRVLTLVSKASDETREQFHKLGIDFSAAGLRARGLQRFIQDLMAATDSNIDVLARLIPEIRAFQGIAILGGKAADVYAQALEKIGNSVGRTEIEHAKRMDSITMQWKRFQGAISAIVVEFGRHAVPAIKAGLERVSGALVVWFLQNKETIKARGKEWAAVLVRVFSIMVKTFAVVWQIAAPIFFNFTRGLLVMTFALSGLEVVVRSFGVIFGATLHGMITSWNAVANFLNSAREQVGEWTDGMLGGMEIVPVFAKSTLADLEKWVGDLDDKITGPIRENLIATFEEIKRMTDEGGIFGGEMTTKGKAQVQAAMDLLNVFIKGFEESMSQAGKRQIGFWDGLRDGVGNFIRDIEDHFDEGKKAGEGFAKGLTSDFQNLFFAPFDESITSAKEAFVEFGKSILRTIGQVLSEVLARQAVGALFKIMGFGASGGPGAGGSGIPAGDPGGPGGIPLFGEARGSHSNWVKTGNRFMHAMGSTKAVLGQARGHHGVLTKPQVLVRGEGSKNEAVIPMPDNRSVPVKFQNQPDQGGGLQRLMLLIAPDKIVDSGLRGNSRLVKQIQAMPFQAQDVEQYRILRGKR